jgi:hypothetical protein
MPSWTIDVELCHQTGNTLFTPLQQPSRFVWRGIGRNVRNIDYLSLLLRPRPGYLDFLPRFARDHP